MKIVILILRSLVICSKYSIILILYNCFCSDQFRFVIFRIYKVFVSVN